MTDTEDTKHQYAETLNADKSLTIELQFPVDVPTGDDITNVTLHRMKQKEVKALRKQYKDNEEFGDALIAKSLQMTDEDIGEIDMEDFAHISDRFSKMVGFSSN